jgi:hypothetical protein
VPGRRVSATLANSRKLNARSSVSATTTAQQNRADRIAYRPACNADLIGMRWLGRILRHDQLFDTVRRAETEAAHHFRHNGASSAAPIVQTCAGRIMPSRFARHAERRRCVKALVQYQSPTVTDTYRRCDTESSLRRG